MKLFAVRPFVFAKGRILKTVISLYVVGKCNKFYKKQNLEKGYVNDSRVNKRKLKKGMCGKIVEETLQ